MKNLIKFLQTKELYGKIKKYNLFAIIGTT